MFGLELILCVKFIKFISYVDHMTEAELSSTKALWVKVEIDMVGGITAPR